MSSGMTTNTLTAVDSLMMSVSIGGSDVADHRTLATRWAAYNSASGRASTKQVDRIIQQLSHMDLIRMLAERNVSVTA